MEKHPTPRWTVKTTWYWEQTFPANSETRVEHSYKPATGESAGTSLGWPGQVKEDWFKDYQQKYCLDRDFLNTMSRTRAASKNEFGAPFTEQRISYILKTAPTGRVPIRDFRLVVDKTRPNVVSFCGQGVKKISATQFEIRRQNFYPDRGFSRSHHEADRKPLSTIRQEIRGEPCDRSRSRRLDRRMVWRDAARILRKQGYDVYAPTLTGLPSEITFRPSASRSTRISPMSPSHALRGTRERIDRRPQLRRHGHHRSGRPRDRAHCRHGLCRCLPAAVEPVALGHRRARTG